MKQKSRDGAQAPSQQITPTDDAGLKDTASKAQEAIQKLDNVKPERRLICHCRVPGCPVGNPWIDMDTDEVVWRR
jgi:hypothetical protein